LFRIYAKCIDGQEAMAKSRIIEAMRDDQAGGDAKPPA
jgi:hypothetical protein